MRPATWWPVTIVAVLAVTVGANLALVVAARDPNAYVVEPHYYEKGLAWDSTLALARRSAALGWSMDATLGGATAASSQLVVTLADSSGAPIRGASTNVELIHNLSPETPLHARLTEVAPGRYAAAVRLSHPGQWELRFHARRGDASFVADIRRDAVLERAR